MTEGMAGAYAALLVEAKLLLGEALQNNDKYIDPMFKGKSYRAWKKRVRFWQKQFPQFQKVEGKGGK